MVYMMLCSFMIAADVQYVGMTYKIMLELVKIVASFLIVFVKNQQK